MTSSPHGIYVQGYTRTTMSGTNGGESEMTSESRKTCLGSVKRLQLSAMNLELLVIVDQHSWGNTFPGLVHSARHTTEVDCSRSG